MALQMPRKAGTKKLKRGKTETPKQKKTAPNGLLHPAPLVETLIS
jgi:hypothetical protein